MLSCAQFSFFLTQLKNLSHEVPLNMSGFGHMLHLLVSKCYVILDLIRWTNNLPLRFPVLHSWHEPVNFAWYWQNLPFRLTSKVALWWLVTVSLEGSNQCDIRCVWLLKKKKNPRRRSHCKVERRLNLNNINVLVHHNRTSCLYGCMIKPLCSIQVIASGCFFSVALQMLLKHECFSKAQVDSSCRKRAQLRTYVTAYSVRNTTTVSVLGAQVRERGDEGVTH